MGQNWSDWQPEFLFTIEAYVNTLLHLHDSSQQYESKSNGNTLGLGTASIVLILSFFIISQRPMSGIW
jgi:hypothetical protein